MYLHLYMEKMGLIKENIIYRSYRDPLIKLGLLKRLTYQEPGMIPGTPGYLVVLQH